MGMVDQVVRAATGERIGREADQVARIRALLARAETEGMDNDEIVDRIAAILGARAPVESRHIYQKPLG